VINDMKTEVCIISDMGVKLTLDGMDSVQKHI
jgi:hypothetical protein